MSDTSALPDEPATDPTGSDPGRAVGSADTTPIGDATVPPGSVPPGPIPPGRIPPGQVPPGPPPGYGPPPFGGWTPPPGWPGAARPALLRRSREDRVAVGLAGGLGRYFSVDPVIFRVIFGVLTLFGGSGIVLYLLGWAAIPDEGTVDAPVDRAISAMRRRHVPLSAVLIVGLVVVWGVFFSWWAPFSFIPAIALVAVIALLLMRSGRPIRIGDPAMTGAGWTPPSAPYAYAAPGATVPDPTFATAQDYTAPGYTAPDYTAPDYTTSDYAASGGPPAPSAGGSELRAWFSESRVRARQRQQRRQPIERAAVLVSIAVLGVLAVRDVTHGVPFNAYFFALGGIVFVALLVGGVLRRTPWPLLPLLIPAAIGVFVFGSSAVSAHDGWGDRTWNPSLAGGLSSDYKVAFGRGTLDLTGFAAPTTATSTEIRMGAGQVRVIVPPGLAVQVVSNVHIGDVEADANPSNSGLNFDDTYLSPAALANPTKARVTVRVKLASGEVSIDDGR